MPTRFRTTVEPAPAGRPLSAPQQRQAQRRDATHPLAGQIQQLHQQVLRPPTQLPQAVAAAQPQRPVPTITGQQQAPATPPGYEQYASPPAMHEAQQLIGLTGRTGDPQGIPPVRPQQEIHNELRSILGAGPGQIMQQPTGIREHLMEAARHQREGQRLAHEEEQIRGQLGAIHAGPGRLDPETGMFFDPVTGTARRPTVFDVDQPLARQMALEAGAEYRSRPGMAVAPAEEATMAQLHAERMMRRGQDPTGFIQRAITRGEERADPRLTEAAEQMFARTPTGMRQQQMQAEQEMLQEQMRHQAVAQIPQAQAVIMQQMQPIAEQIQQLQAQTDPRTGEIMPEAHAQIEQLQRQLAPLQQQLQQLGQMQAQAILGDQTTRPISATRPGEEPAESPRAPQARAAQERQQRQQELQRRLQRAETVGDEQQAQQARTEMEQVQREEVVDQAFTQLSQAWEAGQTDQWVDIVMGLVQDHGQDEAMNMIREARQRDSNLPSPEEAVRLIQRGREHQRRRLVQPHVPFAPIIRAMPQ